MSIILTIAGLIVLVYIFMNFILPWILASLAGASEALGEQNYGCFFGFLIVAILFICYALWMFDII